MAARIYEGTGAGQGQKNEPVSERAMRPELFPLEEHSALDGVRANQGAVSAALPVSP